ncbi:MAG: hypothetical protein D6798_04925 [Deltaproteobacteria bacterium]|nr:MAG: hypothetical protein D6798_04925 [Deltaproteobacteria bacterium]
MTRTCSLLLLLVTALGSCAPRPAPSPPGGRLNLVLVSIDTMRADRLGRIGRDGRSLTPALDVQAARSRVFTRAYSPSNETLFSHAGIFLGALPSAVGPLDYRSFRLPPDAPTLAARLSRAGWRTEAVVASGHLAPVFGLDAGFQSYQVTDSVFTSFQETMPAALDRLEQLAGGDRPFFLFVHGYDCHSPYVKPGPLHHPETPGYDGLLAPLAANPLTWERIYDGAFYPDFQPPDLRAGDVNALDARVFDALRRHAAHGGVRRVALSEADRAFVRGVYDGAVAYADTWVGRLFRRIDALGLAGTTVVAVMSDHGEDLLDHGFVNHRVSLHDENTHVVFMVAGPGVRPGRVDDIVSMTALPDALLALVGAGDGPSLDELAVEVAPSESMLGEVSVRTAAGRARAPATALTEARPASPVEGMELLDDAGDPMAWDDPRADELWRALWEAWGS